MSDEWRSLGKVDVEVFDSGEDATPGFRFTARVRVAGAQDDHRGATLEEALAAGAQWAAQMLPRDAQRTSPPASTGQV